MNLVNQLCKENNEYQISRVLDFMSCKLPVLQLDLEAESKKHGIPIEYLRMAFKKTMEFYDTECISLYPQEVLNISSSSKIATMNLVGDVYPGCKFIENHNYSDKIDSIETQGPVFSIYSIDEIINNKIEEGLVKLSGFWIGTKTNLRLARLFLTEEN